MGREKDISHLCNVSELPSPASLDDIAGRFESGVLTLTVPKRAYSGVPAPTSIEEIKRDKPGVAKEDVRPPPTKDVDGSDKKAASGGDSTTKPKEEIAKEEDVSNKAMDEATKNAQQQKQPEEASNHKQEEQKLAPEPEAKKEQEVKPEAPEKPAPEPEVAIDEKDKAVVDQESLAAGVRRRIEEEKAKAAAAAMEAKAVLEKKATACSGWKQRVAGGLEQLTDMKWADSVVEKARNNKEVVAIAIAAFSLGFFVSHKLFRKSMQGFNGDDWCFKARLRSHTGVTDADFAPGDVGGPAPRVRDLWADGAATVPSAHQGRDMEDEPPAAGTAPYSGGGGAIAS
ncbi:hypothetical protein TRIUR3_06691 [Triticum urartu]|uniref:SHSP domain-containing protein n=1 Tax=Triticum urartu TaxID=4572 RepID=M7Z4L1_TRIUA|nr:hypothetical protein TRIUR3_06691 [Triticum urartu]